MKNINFKTYCEIIKSDVLEFRKGFEWSIDDWNESYIDFKESVSNWKPEYLKSKSGKELAIEWAKDFYMPADRDNNNYWVVERNGDWYVSSVTKPEKNVSVLVFIPEEDNHITSGMWDVDNEWVLLDEDRVPVCEVTHWMPIPKKPIIN